MNQTAKQSSDGSSQTRSPAFIKGLWGVRYQVKDVSRSVNFYTQRLGFNLDQQHLPAFAQVSVGDLKLILSGPGASGSRPILMAGSRNPVDGIECFCKWTTCRRESRR